MKRILKTATLLAGCLIVLSLTSCFTYDKYNTSKYITTFNYVKTGMFQWSGIRGGIYWIDNKRLILEAYIEDESGLLDRGLYQVNVTNGGTEKIIDIIPEEGKTFFNYCFDGTTLYAWVEKGEFIQVSQPEDYSVSIRTHSKEQRMTQYSKLRCNFIERPQIERTTFLPLKAEDGMIKNDATLDDGKKRAFIVDDEGNHLKQIFDKTLDQGISSSLTNLKAYVPHLEAYFFQKPFKNDCAYITHLYRDSWQLEEEELCITDWVFGSRMISRLNDAYYVEHHNSKSREPKHYVFVKDLKIPLSTTQVRGSSVSPDGCIVAYGVGDRTFGKKHPRQELEIFTFCEFREKELALDA